MTNSTIMTNFKLKAGLYYVSDPCYLYPEDKWSSFCDKLSNCREDLFEEGGVQFPVIGTAFGDGYYNLTKKGKSIGAIAVDAGLLAVIPAQLVKRWKNLKKAKDYQNRALIVLIELKEDAAFSCSEGNFSLGDYSVITDGSDEDENEDDE